MRPVPRLSRTQVLARMRAHAKAHGTVSTQSLYAHDRIVLRSIPLYFVGISAAREAAGVSGPEA